MTCLAQSPVSLDLEFLGQLAEVRVEQIVTWFSSCKFVVTSQEDEVLFHLEDSYVCTFLMSGSRRPFHVRASDTRRTTVFAMRRPYHFFSDKVEVLMDGRLQSVIRKQQTVKPLYSINDASDNPVLRVKGNFTAGAFKLQTMDKQLIGSITHRYGGAARALACAGHYEVVFPRDLDTRYKVAVIATCIFIDYRYH